MLYILTHPSVYVYSGTLVESSWNLTSSLTLPSSNAVPGLLIDWFFCLVVLFVLNSQKILRFLKKKFFQANMTCRIIWTSNFPREIPGLPHLYIHLLFINLFWVIFVSENSFILVKLWIFFHTNIIYFKTTFVSLHKVFFCTF